MSKNPATASGPKTDLFPAPGEIFAHLDRFVRGQMRAKRDLAVAVYNHYLSLACRDRDGEDLGRHHVLLLGPTGVGKTHLVKTLAGFLGVPVGFSSATSLVEVGYKGSSAESVVKTLLDRCGGDVKNARRGIIFIDEIDKIKRGETGGTRDVSGEGVQSALLTLLDGRLSSGEESNPHSEIDTSDLLFICAGAFVGLDKIVTTRLSKQRSPGFHGRAEEEVETIPNRPVYEALCQATSADLVAFGMIPEFIGRFSTVTVLHELSRRDFRKILSSNIERSPLVLQRRIAALHGIELQFDDEALDAIADEAMALGTGARGLHRQLNRALEAVHHKWPELADQGVRRVVVTRASITDKAEPRLEDGVATFDREDLAIRRAIASGETPPPAPARNKSAAGQPTTEAPQRAPVPKDDWARIEELKAKELGWASASAEVKKWWNSFERENRGRPGVPRQLCEELAKRKATISQLYHAYLQSGTDNIQANLYYLDYLLLKTKSTDPAWDDS